MQPELRRFGASASPVVVVDDATCNVARVVDIAAALAPFPPIPGSYYPGLRRVIEAADRDAHTYASALLESVAPLIGGAFDIDCFDWIEASFSMVTDAPETLRAAQRAPHFDTTDAKHLAILHYLSDTPDTGTAFYRQRSTGIEVVDEGNVDAFVAAARRESAALSGYTNASNSAFEQIGAVDARPDRLLIYQGSLLHSGIIPPGMNRSADPRQGRLTANLFVQGH